MVKFGDADICQIMIKETQNKDNVMLRLHLLFYIELLLSFYMRWWNMSFVFNRYSPLHYLHVVVSCKSHLFYGFCYVYYLKPNNFQMTKVTSFPFGLTPPSAAWLSISSTLVIAALGSDVNTWNPINCLCLAVGWFKLHWFYHEQYDKAHH